MSDFPLSPFLASLATDGIQLTISDYARLHHVLQNGGDWTITRLRDTLLALLAHDADQQELFLRRFNDFFAPSLPIDEAVAALDLQQVLADLKRLAAEQEQVAPRSQPIFSLPTISLPTLPRPPKPQFGFWTLWSTLLVLGLLTVGYFLSPFVLPLSPTKPPPTPVMQVTPSVSSSQPKPVSPRKRLYTDVPYVAKISYEPLTTWEAWQRDAGLAAFFFFAALLYGLYLWRSHKIPEDEAPSYNPDGPRHFPLGSIGGQPAPFLSDATLNELADCMGYFQSDEGGHRLDVPTSIQATMRKGGVPALTFHKRQQLRSLLILEDDFAEALTWNSLARELAAGMMRLGVPVVYGRFHGSPVQFKTPDGLVHRLEDLEDQRRGYLLLIFTDGKSLQRQTSTFALEALARWPMVAWMELREPRAWDESATLPAHYGIPLYPASPAGVLHAVRRFLTEHEAEMDYAHNGHPWRSLPNQAGTQTDAYIEQRLGDALLWAQDCAMFQPISPGLVDKLRRAFHPNLPAERIERLYELPDTQYDVAGLRFSADVLRVLRTGFLVRRTEAEQEKVLHFLLQQIEKEEPTAEDSLAHLAWEAMKERVHLELEQNEALARLAQLAKTPIGPAISVSLEGFGFYEDNNEASADKKIPLRLKPNNRYAWQRLARITDNFNIPKLEAYPIAWGHRLAISLLALLFVGSSSLSIANYRNPALTAQNWRVTNAGETYAMLKSKAKTDDKWSMEKADDLAMLTAIPLHLDREYQLVLYGNGYKTIKGIPINNHQVTVVAVQTKEMEANCREDFPNIGVIVERCVESDNYSDHEVRQVIWRNRGADSTRHGRLLSIGLEIVNRPQDSQKLQYLRDLLLGTSSVDIIYRVQIGTDRNWHLDKALQYIREDLGSLLGRSQLIWWTNGQIPNTYDLDDLLSNFDRNLKLSDEKELYWADKLAEFLERGPGELVTEQEILKELGKVTVRENPAQIVLYRSLKAKAAVINPDAQSTSIMISPLSTNLLIPTPQQAIASDDNNILTATLPATPVPLATRNKDFLLSAAEQIQVAIRHAGFLHDALAKNDFATVQRHAEHIVNILDGKDGFLYGDVNKDGRIENPGDGFGVRVYLAEAQTTVITETNALTATASKAWRNQAQLAQLSIENGRQLIGQASEQALQIFAADTVTEANGIAGELSTLLTKTKTDIDNASTASLQMAEFRSSPPVSTVLGASAHAQPPTIATTPTAIATNTTHSTNTPTEQAPTPTSSSQPIITATFTPRPVAVFTPLPGTPAPSATQVKPTDNAVYVFVAAGSFVMGSTTAKDEQPVHSVTLNAFWIMQTEVTNAQYARCVAAKVCTPPTNQIWGKATSADHPVTNVNWEQANQYASWAGGRLPTEAEWEKAARGTDERMYPWGNQDASDQLLNYNFVKGATMPVGSYPNGVSPYKALDMAGNVEEWVADWYADSYYANSPAENPPGPDKGIFRVVRGGSFNSTRLAVRTTARSKALPNTGFPSVGFRVVKLRF